MRSSSIALFASCLLSLIATVTPTAAGAPDWSRFRGPNGSGISTATNVPTEFGPSKNLLWRLPLPQGHSSPILHGDRIYLTGFRADTLVTIAIDRHAGRVLWERIAPQVKTKVVDKRNNPASPSPAVEENGVYVFFPDYGLIAYDASGKERWHMALGPFNNIYGMGASPVLVGDLVVLVCDQSVGSFIMALEKRTGRVRWKMERPEAKSGHSTPILWRGPDGKDQILVPGSFLLTSYDAATGRKLWWVGGLSFEMKSTPVIGGDTIYVNGYGAPVNDPGNKVIIPSADEVWKTSDADGDGLLSKAEFPKFTGAFWFLVADLDTSGALTRDEWAYYRAALDSENGMLAIRLGGSGDMSDTAIRWKYQRSVPQLPSPLLYRGMLYMVNDNGIVTTLDPETGAVIKQGRLTGALGPHFASPVAADGHVFFTSEAGAVVVVPPGGDLTPKVVNDLAEDTYATPAIADGRIYVRTTAALYAFGESQPAKTAGNVPAFQMDPPRAGEFRNSRISVSYASARTPYRRCVSGSCRRSPASGSRLRLR
jgi:outer membrane protein assembly factor BamB